METQRGAVFVEPASQLRPLADQRLVRELHRALVDGDEPRRGQSSEDRRDLALVRARELRQRSPPARVLHAFAGLDEPQQDPTGELLLARIERLEDAIGRGRDRRPHASGAAVRLERQRAPVARRPRRQQRSGRAAGARRVRWRPRSRGGRRGPVRRAARRCSRARRWPRVALLRSSDRGAAGATRLRRRAPDGSHSCRRSRRGSRSRPVPRGRARVDEAPSRVVVVTQA